MNVIGLAIRTMASAPRSAAVPSSRRHLAISASAGADANCRPPRRASSSTTAKPMLCRVPVYFGPGLPNPTIAFIDAIRAALFLLLLFLIFFFVLLVLVLLTLLDDLRLSRCRRRCGGCRFRRRRCFLG